MTLSPRLPALLSIAAALLLAAPAAAAAQGGDVRVVDSTRTQVVTTRDGSTFVGRVVETTADSVRIQTAHGVITVGRAEIREVREVATSAIRDGEVWLPNPNASRLFFAPTADMLKKGEGYFSDTYLFFINVAVGATDRVTVGGGMSIFPTPDFAQNNIYYFTPKVSVHNGERTKLALGALAAWVPFLDDPGSPNTFGILYGVGTFGSPDGSVTLGTGYGFAGSSLADRPLFMVGGQRRVSKRVALLTENYIWPVAGTNPLVSYGVRLFSDKLSVDLGFWNVLSGDAIFPGIPYLGFATKF